MGRAEEALARIAVSTRHQAWSDEARKLAQVAIADTLATGIAGMLSEQTISARLATSCNTGPGSVPVWEGTARYAPADAAFILGVASHSLDWDDYMHPMHGHCSSVLLPVAWTIAEHTGASGEELLNGFLAGYQVNYLASLAFGNAHYVRGWHATSTVGTLGAAAVAARMLQLTYEQTQNALAIASSLASGLRVNFGSPTKALHAGSAARHGVEAALLARSGARGSSDWLLGNHGMLATFGGEVDAPAAEQLILDAFPGPHGILTAWGLVQKPYSCCGSCHAAVEGVIALATAHDLNPSDLEAFEVHLDPLVPSIMQVGVPTDPYSARYSLSWALAAAMVDRAAGPRQFSAAALERDDIHSMRRRIAIVADLQNTDHDRFGARIVVRYKGIEIVEDVRHSTGHPERPMTSTQRESKQREALSFVTDPGSVVALMNVTAELDSPIAVSELGDKIRFALATKADTLTTAT